MNKLYENDKLKCVISENYNYEFDKKTGNFRRWGKTLDDDPEYSEFGPEILDIEITDICDGIGNEGPCPFCYKSNTKFNNSNMSFETFRHILDSFPKVLTQIAIGADAKGISNPDMFKMMEYSRSKGIIPNITIADISDETADKLVELCGAVAVSRYSNKEYCYDSIKKLTDRGLKQVNIHIMVSDLTIDQIYETFNDYLNGEERLKGLNAIVLLSLKQKGRGKYFNPLSQEKFKEMVEFALKNNIPIGFDSCGAHKFLNSVNDSIKKKVMPYIEPCESSLFSSYVNSEGIFFPCSFLEKKGNWKQGIDLKKDIDFLKDVWYNEKIIEFRNTLLKNDRRCPVYNI